MSAEDGVLPLLPATVQVANAIVMIFANIRVVVSGFGAPSQKLVCVNMSFLWGYVVEKAPFHLVVAAITVSPNLCHPSDVEDTKKAQPSYRRCSSARSSKSGSVKSRI